MQHVENLIRNGFKGGADYVFATGTARNARNKTACGLVPVRSAQTHKRGDKVNASAVVHGARKFFAFRGGGNKFHLVPQPLHYRAPHKHAALQDVVGFIGKPRRKGSDQAAGGLHRDGARVHQ